MGLVLLEPSYTSMVAKIDARILGLLLMFACVFCRIMDTVPKSVFQRLGGASNSFYRHQPSASHVPGKVCRNWLSGSCTRNPCRFLHPHEVAPSKVMSSNSLKSKQSHPSLKPQTVVSKRANEDQNLRKVKQRPFSNKAYQCGPHSKDNGGRNTGRPSVKRDDDGGSIKRFLKQSNVGGTEKPVVEQDVSGIAKHNGGRNTGRPSVKRDDGGSIKRFLKQSNVSRTEKPVVEQDVSDIVKHNDGVPEKRKLKICEDWINTSCPHGDKCSNLHSWSSSNTFSKMVQLEGHQKAITGINLRSGSDDLFTCSEDETVRIWDCNTGKCKGAVDMGAPVGCLISEGPWVFAGITNAVKAWNIEKQIELTLDAPCGRVYSLAVNNGTLFAGLQDGSIYVWKLNSDATSLDFDTFLKEHTQTVMSLVYGAKQLYSASMDNTIKVWDLETMRCIHTLKKHSDVIMSVVCWERYLLSSSLDKTLKVWAATEAGEVEVAYTHNEEHGILSLCGMVDAAGKPILLCSCNDNSVRIYDLPSFVERGRIFTKQEVRTIHIGPGGLFFTGDGTVVVSVWNCSGSLDKAAK